MTNWKVQPWRTKPNGYIVARTGSSPSYVSQMRARYAPDTLRKPKLDPSKLNLSLPASVLAKQEGVSRQSIYRLKQRTKTTNEY